jgi:hypothetical protein
MLVAKSSSSLSSKKVLEKHYPTQSTNKCVDASIETKARRLNLKKQLDAYKIATADCSQVYDGHDMIPQNLRKSRRNGDVRFELDITFRYCPVKNDNKRREKVESSASPSKAKTTDKLTLKLDGKDTIDDVTATFASFNQDERSTSTSSTAISSLASKSSSSGIQAVPKAYSTKIVKQKVVTKPEKIKEEVGTTPGNANSSSTKPEAVTPSSSQKMVRRKKSSPHHRDRAMNLKLSGIIKTPRYSQSKPEDLSRSLQDIDAIGRVVDERLTKSMTDLETNWSESLDFNSVHFKKNVEVYCYKL